ncbi:MAG: DUF1289 domain-containing protein [Methylocystis sp.]|uniref:DUF1289 domain-containing protein n=1 Tax=Methylocystis sp. TaxID=1911079 RepID=UPI003D12A8CF
MVDSPCVKICELDRNDICVGCGRTRAEIAGWTGMSELQKTSVVSLAKMRQSEKDRAAAGEHRIGRVD